MTAAPLALAALGALLTVLSGPPAVFLEGFMIIGAFGPFALLHLGLPLLPSVLFVLAFSASLAFTAAVFVNRSGANPFMVGLAINMGGAGLVDALSVYWFGTKGVIMAPETANLASPFFKQYYFIALAFFLSLIAIPVLKRTSWGLRLRACGADENAAAARGINSGVYRGASWAAAAALAALAGAALSCRVGAYAPGGVAGRGWIALVLVYLGFRQPLGILAAATLFAAAETLASYVQGWSALPATVLLGLPSALALTAFIASSALRRHVRLKTGKPSVRLTRNKKL